MLNDITYSLRVKIEGLKFQFYEIRERVHDRCQFDYLPTTTEYMTKE